MKDDYFTRSKKRSFQNSGDDISFDPDYVRLKSYHPGLLKRFWFRLGEVLDVKYKFDRNELEMDSLGIEIWDSLKREYVYLMIEIDMIAWEVNKGAITLCIWRFTRWIRNIWRG